MTIAADKLRALLIQPGFIIMPCCFDAFLAKLIGLLEFAALREIVDFPAYDEAEQKYVLVD